MEARTGSMTIAALLGTGLATLGFALSGVSALGDDLQAARVAAPASSTPVLTPSEERRESTPGIPSSDLNAPGTTEASPQESLTLQQACNRKRRGDRRSGEPTGAATVPDETPATTPASTPAKQY